MDLSFTEEQSMLRDMSRKLCEESAPLSVLREHEGRVPGYSAGFWNQLGELGLTGICIDENYGGLGLGMLENVILCEELGRSLSVTPFHASSILAADLITAIGSDTQKDKWLTAISAGTSIFTVAVSEPAKGALIDDLSTRVSRKGNKWLLSGVKHLVPFAEGADGVIVIAKCSEDKEQIFAVVVEPEQLKAQSTQWSCKYQENHVGDPLYKIQINTMEVPAENILGASVPIGDHWERVVLGSLIPLAAYAIGAAQRIHNITLEYAKYREAFGRPIGGFQSIAHYLADSTVAIEGAKILVYQAAWSKDQGRDFLLLAAMAKLQGCDAFCNAAAIAIQVHGGIGYTTEADPQLFFVGPNSCSSPIGTRHTWKKRSLK